VAGELPGHPVVGRLTPRSGDAARITIR